MVWDVLVFDVTEYFYLAFDSGFDTNGEFGPQFDTDDKFDSALDTNGEFGPQFDTNGEFMQIQHLYSLISTKSFSK